MTDDIDKLRAETQSGDRLSEPGNDVSAPSLNEFQEEFLENLRDSSGQVATRNISINDPLMWSALAALENDEERFQRLQENAGAERQTKSSIGAVLLRVGLGQIDPELADELDEALDTEGNDRFSQ